MTTAQPTLADRIRAQLADEPTTREVKMFGARAFMVNEQMVVAVRGDGDLLVRADPARADELHALPGAGPAEMGAGRPMGRGWTCVAADAIASEEQLAFWIDVALERNERATGG